MKVDVPQYMQMVSMYNINKSISSIERPALYDTNALFSMAGSNCVR